MRMNCHASIISQVPAMTVTGVMQDHDAHEHMMQQHCWQDSKSDAHGNHTGIGEMIDGHRTPQVSPWHGSKRFHAAKAFSDWLQ
jgi:hypothetical protein